jgi:hypothetical protein
MSMNRMLGLLLLVAGVVFLLLGLTATDTFGESLKHVFTGKYTERTTWYIVGGALAAVIGATIVARAE